MAGTELEEALEHSLRTGADLEATLDEVRQDRLESAKEVELLTKALEPYRPPTVRRFDAARSSVLYSVASLLQDSEDVLDDTVRAEVLPHLIRLLDHHIELEDLPGDEILFAVKVLSLYGSKSVVERIPGLSRAEWIADSSMWEVILRIYAHEDHPHRLEVFNALADPLPERFAAVSYLDMANTLACEGCIDAHPFDTDEGVSRLLSWLGRDFRDDASYAVSAAAAIPFLAPTRGDVLLTRALQHPAAEVRLEGAWAEAKLGGEDGIRKLAAACLDVNLSERAVLYLEELGREDDVPRAALEPDFRAEAEMVSWLAHPLEFGRSPDKLELFDRREIFWPPTNDRRSVYLFKYEYSIEAGEPPEIGLGMVGSVTFALFGETTVRGSPAEAYALHCAWELELNEDERAPAARSVEAGLAILRRYNPGEPDFALH